MEKKETLRTRNWTRKYQKKYLLLNITNRNGKNKKQ